MLGAWVGGSVEVTNGGLVLRGCKKLVFKTSIYFGTFDNSYLVCKGPNDHWNINRLFGLVRFVMRPHLLNLNWRWLRLVWLHLIVFNRFVIVVLQLWPSWNRRLTSIMLYSGVWFLYRRCRLVNWSHAVEFSLQKFEKIETLSSADETTWHYEQSLKKDTF